MVDRVAGHFGVCTKREWLAVVLLVVVDAMAPAHLLSTNCIMLNMGTKVKTSVSYSR